MPDQTQRTITGRFSSRVPAFSVPVSTVTFDDDLYGTHRVSGVLGVTSMDSRLDDGVELHGHLMPPLDQGYNIEGHGKWSEEY